MCKKLLITGFLAVVALGIVAKTNWASLAYKKANAAYKKSISPETRLDLIREEVAKLQKDSKEHISTVARETVSVDSLRRQITDSEANQKELFGQLAQLKQDIQDAEAAGDKFVTYDTRKYPLSRLQTKLESDWGSFKRGEESLKNLKQLLETREVALTSARERLSELNGKKEELELEVSKLETDIKNVRLAQTKTKCTNFDDGRVGEIKKSLQEVREWIQSKKVEAELEATYSSDPIPVAKKAKATVDVMAEIDSYRANQPKSASTTKSE